jgi:hypothetical protein
MESDVEGPTARGAKDARFNSGADGRHIGLKQNYELQRGPPTGEDFIKRGSLTEAAGIAVENKCIAVTTEPALDDGIDDVVRRKLTFRG